MKNTMLAFEIGTEELPAFDLHAATTKIGELAQSLLEAARVPHGKIEVYSTPRRLIVTVEEMADSTQECVEEYRGPAVRIAFDEAGAPTKAAIGFARGKGVDADTLERRDENGVEYVYAVKRSPAVPVADLLPGLLQSLIKDISWPKSQRWGSRNEQFSRPIRWLLALLGDVVVPVEFAGLHAGAVTYGHRFLAPGPHAVDHASLLIDVLRKSYVVPSEVEREASIREQIAALEKESGLVAELPAKTMAEVINLTEYPTVMMGAFNQLFLDVPKEITVDAMLVHQRYFPLFDKAGNLSNHFLITSNGNPDFRDNIVDGNQRVVAARLYDAKFFYDEDRKQPLEAYVDKLDSVVFQESLGTMRAKTNRIETLVDYLCENAGVESQQRVDAVRAAHLCKADLVTGAVVEFTSVQGIMGRYYAAASGETDVVAQAIADHYRPRFSGDDVPESVPGCLVAMADKLDTVCGLFAVGQGPTGSSDPFALRRAALGIVTMLVGRGSKAALQVQLVPAIDVALTSYETDGIDFDRDSVRGSVIDFFITRTKVMLRDEGCAVDTIDAVLAAKVIEPAMVVARTRALETARKQSHETFDDLATAYARANNLRDANLGSQVDSSLLLKGTECHLASAIEAADDAVCVALNVDDYAAALEALASLRGPIDCFFEDVLVMDDDATLRANHLRLLNRFVEVFANVADFGLMAKS